MRLVYGVLGCLWYCFWLTGVEFISINPNDIFDFVVLSSIESQNICSCPAKANTHCADHQKCVFWTFHHLHANICWFFTFQSSTNIEQLSGGQRAANDARVSDNHSLWSKLNSHSKWIWLHFNEFVLAYDVLLTNGCIVYIIPGRFNYVSQKHTKVLKIVFEFCIH